MLWTEALARLPLVAILRGLKPSEAEGVGEALIDAGFAIVEVPLNSPDPFVSIATLARTLKGRAVVGAGTVLKVSEVTQLEAAGGRVCISPNTNADVIRAARAADMISFPAFYTPTEAFAAIEAGAHALKLFPAEVMGPAGLKAVKAVLPKDMPVFAVGGVTPQTLKDWVAAGAAGFGIGSAVYKPGDTPKIVHAKASSFVAAWKAL